MKNIKVYDPYNLFEFREDEIILKDNASGLEEICNERSVILDFSFNKKDLNTTALCVLDESYYSGGFTSLFRKPPRKFNEKSIVLIKGDIFTYVPSSLQLDQNIVLIKDEFLDMNSIKKRDIMFNLAERLYETNLKDITSALKHLLNVSIGPTNEFTLKSTRNVICNNKLFREKDYLLLLQGEGIKIEPGYPYFISLINRKRFLSRGDEFYSSDYFLSVDCKHLEIKYPVHISYLGTPLYIKDLKQNLSNEINKSIEILNTVSFFMRSLFDESLIDDCVSNKIPEEKLYLYAINRLNSITYSCISKDLQQEYKLQDLDEIRKVALLLEFALSSYNFGLMFDLVVKDNKLVKKNGLMESPR